MKFYTGIKICIGRTKWCSYAKTISFKQKATRASRILEIVDCSLIACNPPFLGLSREEQEKLNVWVALLNLENMYGTEESLQKVFERAIQYCEPMPVYQQLADIYTKSDKIRVRICPLVWDFILI